MSLRPGLLALLSICSFGQTACGLLAGLDDFQRHQPAGGETSQGGEGGAGASGAGGLGGATGGSGGVYVSHCPDGSVEAPDAPTGFSGPYLVTRATEEAALAQCPTGQGGGGQGGGPGAPLTFHQDASAAPASCTCACGSPVGSKCRASLTYHQSGSNCASATGTTETVGPGCNNLQFGGTDFRWQWDPAPIDVCDPSLQDEQKPSATWSSHTRLCPAVIEAVDELGCTAEPSPPFEGRLCFVGPSNLSCPLPFAEVLDSSFVDTRGCGCACAPTGVICSGQLRIFTQANCAGANTQWLAGQCVPLTTEPSLEMTTVGATGTCTALDTPQGDVTGDGAFTLCCPQPP